MTKCFAAYSTCCFLFCCLTVFSSAAKAEWHRDMQPIMGTEVSVTLWHKDEQLAKGAMTAVMDEMRRINDTLSPYIESSDLSQVNRLAAQSPQSISSELAYLVDKSLFFSRLSEGAFDITYASVGWRYDYREKNQPSQGEIASLLPAINYQWLELDKSSLTLKYGHENVRIDLGGIAKGYAVDRAADKLVALGVEHATVSAGGDSRIIGDRRGRPWIIGIKKPRAANGTDEAAIKLPLQDVAISTSGDYERFFIDEKTGERIHHILNPKTGGPAQGVTSVTVLGPLGADTDPLSTSVFVMGVERGLALINKLPGFDCIIIDRYGKVHYSAELLPAK